jgi:hypothetical protein
MNMTFINLVKLFEGQKLTIAYFLTKPTFLELKMILLQLRKAPDRPFHPIPPHTQYNINSGRIADILVKKTLT